MINILYNCGDPGAEPLVSSLVKVMKANNQCAFQETSSDNDFATGDAARRIFILGSSSDGAADARMIRAARLHDFVTVGCVDANLSLPLRFRLSENHHVYPDILVCTTSATAEYFCEQGLFAERVICVGYQHLRVEQSTSLLRARSIDDDLVIGLCLEPQIPAENISSFINFENLNCKKERSHFLYHAVSDAVNVISKRHGVQIDLLVRFHPKNIRAEFEYIWANDNARLSDGPVENFFAQCDACVGLTSVVLFQAFLRGIPSYSVVVCRNDERELPGDVPEAIKQITSAEKLECEVEKLLQNQVKPKECNDQKPEPVVSLERACELILRFWKGEFVER